MNCWLNRPRRKEEEIRWILSFSLQRVNEREKERESLLAFVVLKDGRTSAAVRELSLSLSPPFTSSLTPFICPSLTLSHVRRYLSEEPTIGKSVNSLNIKDEMKFRSFDLIFE